MQISWHRHNDQIYVAFPQLFMIGEKKENHEIHMNQQFLSNIFT